MPSDRRSSQRRQANQFRPTLGGTAPASVAAPAAECLEQRLSLSSISSANQSTVLDGGDVRARGWATLDKGTHTLTLNFYTSNASNWSSYTDTMHVSLYDARGYKLHTGEWVLSLRSVGVWVPGPSNPSQTSSINVPFASVVSNAARVSVTFS